MSGLAGGAVFGMLMAMMGMLKMIAGMVGSSSPVVGFLIHMGISAIIGAGFGLAFDRFATSRGKATIAGLLYGFIWWLLGPLTLMPLMMGMGLGSQWNATAVASTMPSLMGHLVYGAILGFIYFHLAGRERVGQAAQLA